jgi:hypothetical protein
MFILKFIKKIDNLREAVENKIADILQKIDENSQVSEIEIQILAQTLQLALNSCRVCLPEETVKEIATIVVTKGLHKVNEAIETQLRK